MEKITYYQDSEHLYTMPAANRRRGFIESELKKFVFKFVNSYWLLRSVSPVHLVK